MTDSPRPIITGPVVDSHTPQQLPPNRRNFRELVNDKYQFSLYILALQSIQADPYRDNFSFVSIGGIHGLPYIQWGDSGGAEPIPGTDFGGYCTHGSVIFPTWHRPYVALFEALSARAVSIAKEYKTEQDKWHEAAVTLRSPFWDWASAVPQNGSAVPEQIITPTITITTPEGEKTIDNPVYDYVFHSKFPVDTFDSPFNQWGRTLRYPTSSGSDAKSDMAKFVSTYGENAAQIRTETYNCLTRLVTWPYFSNHTTKQNPPIANSLETIHDTMHTLIGGTDPNGHMAYVPVSSFDAAFWLHHTNVDRLLALWQALNPDVWVTPGDQPGGTYTITDDGTVDVNSDLTPFWRTQNAYWKSTEVHKTQTFHYSYPEFNGLQGSSPAEVRQRILSIINELYGSSKPSATIPASTHAPLPAAPLQSTVGSSTFVDHIHEWNLHIRFKKYELGSSFSVVVYLEDEYVGCISSFATRNVERCANCRANVEREIEGFVHLTDILVKKYPNLHSLEPQYVRPILAAHIQLGLRGRKADGSSADIYNDLPSLKVAAYSQFVTQGPEDDLPTLGQVTYHHDVLEGKPGHVPAGQWGA